MRGSIKKVAATGFSAVALSMLFGSAAGATGMESQHGDYSRSQYKYQAYQYPEPKAQLGHTAHASYQHKQETKEHQPKSGYQKDYKHDYKTDDKKAEEQPTYKNTDYKQDKHDAYQKPSYEKSKDYGHKAPEQRHVSDHKDNQYQQKDGTHVTHHHTGPVHIHYTFKDGKVTYHKWYKDGRYVVTTASYHHSEQQQMATQMKLEAPLREHAAVGVAALRADHLNQPDAAALDAAVHKNSVEIAKVVEKAYPAAQGKFLPLWESHIGYYKDYLKAAEAKDEAGKKEAKENLTHFTHQVTDLLDKSGHKVNKEELQRAMAMHGDQVTSILDDFVAGEYDRAWTKAHEAYEHMGHVAKLLAKGAHTSATAHYL